MDGIKTPPPIPSRTRQHARRRSLQGPTTPASNRVHVQPASPEIISSLISSLSIISAGANQLFEHPGGSQSTPTSPAATATTFTNLNSYMSNGAKSSEGSFGLDFGAYTRPSLTDLQEDEALDELAASPPVIRTAKPPSGFSPLTAPPKSPGRDGNHLKNFMRGSSRPSSKGSGASKDVDDASSIGNVSIEPGAAPTFELRHKSSSDSWGKKQARNQKGLMYMSSKERLRERELERKRISGATGGSTKGLGGDRAPPPPFDADSFMAETAIGEEPEETTPKRGSAAPSPSIGGMSPGPGATSPGGIGSGRFIPARDSSLRNSTASTIKRSSQRLSRHSGKQRDSEYVDDSAQMLDLQTPEHSRERNRRDRHAHGIKAGSKMLDQLDSLEMPQQAATATSKQVTNLTSGDRLRVNEETEDSAPSPAVSQRKARPSPDRGDGSFSQRKSQTKAPPEPINTTPQGTRSGSKLKRLSAPLSPRASEADQHQSSSSNPLRVSSPEPTRTPQIHVDDRPTSVDSIDDAVDAYLSSPRLSQKIRHPQTGRVISFSEVGDPDGFAVFCCVGMGLTRYIMAFYDELALTLKLRLITPDRPGVGDSAPYSDGTSTPLSWPDDVYTICQTLKINKFSILAHSAGAIYALATALRMPQHIRGRIHLLAPWIPPSQMNVVGGHTASPPSNALPTSQRILRALPTPILKAANSSFMSATSSSITSSLPKAQKRGKRKSTGRDTPALAGRSTFSPAMDKQNHGRDAPASLDRSKQGGLDRAAANKSDPNSEAAVVAAAANSVAQKERQMTYDARLTQAIWDLATSGANPAVDLLVCLERQHTIGFRYVDITRAVVINHGSKDTRVPVENVKWLGKTMRRCEVRVLEGEGHGLMASAAVMGGVLMEIAREWEDWAKVTGLGKDEAGRRALRERASVGAFR